MALMDYRAEQRDARDAGEADQDRPTMSDLVTLTCKCENEADRDWYDDGEDRYCVSCGELVEPE